MHLILPDINGLCTIFNNIDSLMMDLSHHTGLFKKKKLLKTWKLWKLDHLVTITKIHLKLIVPYIDLN